MPANIEQMIYHDFYKYEIRKDNIPAQNELFIGVGSQIPNLSNSRHAICQVGSKVFLFGGLESMDAGLSQPFRYNSIVVVYNLEEHKLTRLNDLPFE
jgi:hypothetical protein